ncbi:MAG: hypothetical protein IPJ82_23545 [Lewinellaceae bacterium]|nr:hypothetical protein [Lewinellaceae bacterium]
MNASLPAAGGGGNPDYIVTGADLTYSGSSEMFIAKFSSLNVLDWGTYVGGGEEETFNDLEVFADGRVAFVGLGNNTNGTLTEVNGAAGGSNSNGDTDGLIGVLNSTGTTFNYLDEIGGNNDDRINDVEIVGSTLYWTGSAESGFPTSVGAYDVTHNGSLDVIVGSVSAAGSTGYTATFYGGGGDNIGSDVKVVSQTKCDGTVESFLWYSAPQKAPFQRSISAANLFMTLPIMAVWIFSLLVSKPT